MKKILTCLLCLFWVLGLSAQNISQKELTAFCERAIEEHFAEQLAKSEIIIQKDSLFPVTKTDFNTFKIKYVANKELAYQYAKEKEGSEITIYDAYIKTKQDTIDVFIGWFSYKVLAQGETLNIQQQPCFCVPKPVARLIFDKTKQTWAYLSKEGILEIEKRIFLERRGKKYMVEATKPKPFKTIESIHLKVKKN